MRRKGRKAERTTIILVLILIIGLGLVLYPGISNWWNQKVQSRAVADYDEAVSSLKEDDFSDIFAAAEAYNAALAQIGSAAMLSDADLLDGYRETLDITGTGIMGYVTIDKINVQLPIYHGTDASVLSAGAGHLEGSSLPVGGSATHSVISAHRGLPSAKLFTNLDQLEVGDLFTITVLNQVLTYEVDKISIVLPDEFEDLYIDRDEDYCTLMTCTPYGINTHRLLVRGARTEAVKHILVSSEASRVNSLLVAPFLAIPLLIFLLVWLIVSTRRGRDKERTGPEEFIRSSVPGSGGRTPDEEQENRTDSP